MADHNRWAEEDYPHYREDVNGAIGFSGLEVDYFLEGKADSAIRLLKSHMSGAAGAKCLDIGCGIGAMHPALIGKVGHLSGVDVSENAVHSARAANPAVEYDSYDGIKLPYDDDSFDMTLTVCVMHHVPPQEWKHFVSEAWRVTKPGGIFAVYEHNPINPLTRLAVMRCPFDHDAVLLKPKKVERLLADRGFQIIEKNYLFFVPLKARWSKFLDHALRRLPIGAQYVVCGRKPGNVNRVPSQA